MKCWVGVKGGMLLTSQFHHIQDNTTLEKAFANVYLGVNTYSVAYSIYIQGSGSALGRAMQMVSQKNGSLMFGSKWETGPMKNSGSDAFYRAGYAADYEIAALGGNPGYLQHGCGTKNAQDIFSNSSGNYPYCWVDSGYSEVQASAYVGKFKVGGLTAYVSIMLRAQNPGASCGHTCQIDGHKRI